MEKFKNHFKLEKYTEEFSKSYDELIIKLKDKRKNKKIVNKKKAQKVANVGINNINKGVNVDINNINKDVNIDINNINKGVNVDNNNINKGVNVDNNNINKGVNVDNNKGVNVDINNINNINKGVNVDINKGVNVDINEDSKKIPTKLNPKTNKKSNKNKKEDKNPDNNKNNDNDENKNDEINDNKKYKYIVIPKLNTYISNIYDHLSHKFIYSKIIECGSYEFGKKTKYINRVLPNSFSDENIKSSLEKYNINMIEEIKKINIYMYD